MTDYAKTIARDYRKIAKPVRAPNEDEVLELFNYRAGPREKVLDTLEHSYIAVFDNFVPHMPDVGGKGMVVVAPDATGMWDFYTWPDGHLRLRQTRYELVAGCWKQYVLPAPEPFARHRTLPAGHSIIKPVRAPSEQEVQKMYTLNVDQRGHSLGPPRVQVGSLKECYIAAFDNFVPDMPELDGKGMVLVAPDACGYCELFAWYRGRRRLWPSPKALEKQLAIGMEKDLIASC